MLLFFWRASLLLVFPLIILLYMRVANLPFSTVDDGVNHHKWVIIAAYLVYVVFWVIVNRTLSRLLRRRGRR